MQVDVKSKCGFEANSIHRFVRSATIELQYYRVYPFMCEALHLATLDGCDENERQQMFKKQLYVSLYNLDAQIHRSVSLLRSKTQGEAELIFVRLRPSVGK
ncbi:unnamed protein product [Caenorhabditis nigoni]